MTTAARIKRQKRDLKLYNERLTLMGRPGAMATAVDLQLAKKYKVSRSGIRLIIQRCQLSTSPCKPSSSTKN